MSDIGYKELTFHIKGLVPLMLHNGLLSDTHEPRRIALDKAIKASKKTKTKEAAVEMSYHEFIGGLYLDEDGAPCIPGEVMEACIHSGAKQTKDGKAMQAGLFVDSDFPIIYQGPKDADGLWDDRGKGKHEGLLEGRRFVDRRRCKVGQAAVMRTRPIFREWEVIFTVNYDPQLLNKDSVIDFVNAAGRCGLCEMRPRFGRFEVVEIS